MQWGCSGDALMGRTEIPAWSGHSTSLVGDLLGACWKHLHACCEPPHLSPLLEPPALPTNLKQVTLLHVQYLASLGTPQSPLLHLAMQGASVALLMWRAPTGGCLVDGEGASHGGLLLHPMVHTSCYTAVECKNINRALRSPIMLAVCRRYVGIHPSYARMASVAYAVLQHATAVFCPGTGPTLQAAAAAAAPWQKCEAVVWAVEVRGDRRRGVSRLQCRRPGPLEHEQPLLWQLVLRWHCRSSSSLVKRT